MHTDGITAAANNVKNIPSSDGVAAAAETSVASASPRIGEDWDVLLAKKYKKEKLDDEELAEAISLGFGPAKGE